MTMGLPLSLTMGRSGTREHDADMASVPPSSVTLDSLPALHRCASDGTLELLYQPEYDLGTGEIVAMEGLLRWHHEALGVLRPLAFLDLAEASGEIISIGEWVLRAGIEEAQRWSLLAGPVRRLWLNVSPSQLAEPTFADRVGIALRASGLPAGALGFEVPEAGVLALGDAAAPVLHDLRAAGVAIAVDDFSSFYATMGAIAGLPVDTIKLSHRYVRGIGDTVGPDGQGDPIVSAIIDQAHERGLTVVAEGVETWSEAARLIELGCDRAHGWLFASEQRADKARWLLEHGKGWQRAGSVPLPRAEG